LVVGLGGTITLIDRGTTGLRVIETLGDGDGLLQMPSNGLPQHGEQSSDHREAT